jgi:hypothetical protein
MAPQAPAGAFVPADAAVVVNNGQKILFDWPDASDPNAIPDPPATLSYEFRLDDDGEVAADWDMALPIPPGKTSTNLSLPASGHYAWAVRALDDENAASGWTPVLALNFTNTDPNPPVSGFSPANAEVMSNGSVAVSWGAGSDPNPPDVPATLHYVFRIDDDGEVATDWDSEVTLADAVLGTGLSLGGGHYTWAVRTVDDENAASAWSSLRDFFVITSNIGQPVWLDLRTDQRDILLSWELSADPLLGGYTVYRGTAPGTYAFSTNVGKTGQCTLPGVAFDTAYYLCVAAYDIAGRERIRSEERSVMIRDYVRDDRAILFNSVVRTRETPEMELIVKLDAADTVNVRIFSASGILVKEWSADYPPGTYSRRWDLRDAEGTPAASGTYVVAVETKRWSRKLFLGVVR